MERTCYAKVDTFRAALALIAPFIALGAGTFSLLSKGYNLADYPALISNGQMPWFPQLIAWGALMTWIVRYFPPAWTALVDGPCIISSDGQNLFLPHDHRISLDSVEGVAIHREFLRKVVYLERAQGRIAVSLLFVRSSSDAFLRSLASSP